MSLIRGMWPLVALLLVVVGTPRGAVSLELPSGRAAQTGSCVSGVLLLGVLAGASDVTQQAIEERLSIGSMHMLRTVRRLVRRVIRIVSWSVQQWASWTTSALGLVLVALVAPLVDRQLVRAWRAQGFAAFRASALLALAVYVRLLFDRRAPVIGKVLLVCTLLYGAGPGDLIPDRITVIGLIDDVIAIGLASRVFARLCPDWLVEEHAVNAARGWERARHAHRVGASGGMPAPSPPLERQLH